MPEFVIYNMDVLEGLSRIESDSVDCVMTSPPYWVKNSFKPNNNMGTRNQNGTFKKGVHYSKKTEFKKGEHWREKKPYWDKEYLYDEYVKKKKTTAQIALEHDCLDKNIQYFLKKFGIRARTTSEIRKEKYWGLVGADNPMYNRFGELAPNWKGGVTKERQLFYSSIEWRSVCHSVWLRDKAICQRCQTKKSSGIPFHIHHLVSFANRKLRAESSNLVLLCEVCHRFVHSKKNTNRDFIGGLPTDRSAGGDTRK